jgi:hypothetical protein
MNQTRTTVLTVAILGLLCSIFALVEPMRNEIALFFQDIILRRPIDIALWAARLKVAAFVSTVVFSFIITTVIFFYKKTKAALKSLRACLKKRGIGNSDLVVITLIVVVSSIMLFDTVRRPAFVWGESDDFAINIISITEHFSTRVLESDIQYAHQYFPGIADHLQNCYNVSIGKEGRGRIGNITPDGDIYGYYFPIYAIACIPAKYFIQFFLPGTDQSWSMLFTNLLSYTGALFFAFYNLKALKSKQRLLVIALLAVSPVLRYIHAATYETFLYSLVVCSAVMLYRGFYKRALFFAALAASGNPSINGLCAAIVLCWFYEIIARALKDRSTFRGTIKRNYLEAVKLFVCFLPVVTHLLYYKILLGTFTPLAQGQEPWYFSRFTAYLFDLNFGFAGHYPLLLLLLLAGCVLCLYQRNIKALSFPFAIFLSCAVYSSNFHINCGMEGMARYNIYITPLLLIFTTASLAQAQKAFFYKVIMYIGLVSALLCSLLIIINSRYSYVEFYPVPKEILNTYPSLYNPYSYTFISRTYHFDGGYWDLSKQPYWYTDNEGYVRKILVNRESSVVLENMIKNSAFSGNQEDVTYLRNKIPELQYRNDHETDYINLPRNIHLKIRAEGDILDSLFY